MVILSLIKIEANLCNKPEVSFERRYKAENPLRVARSSLLSLKTLTTINCDTTSFRLIRRWALNKLNADKTIGREILLNNNPTSTSAELIFKGNSLEYGLFKIVYSVDVLYNTNDKVTNAVDTFVEVFPTGFIVAAFYAGISEVRIGTSQKLTLDPIKYSYDLDLLMSPSSMKFKFYCRVIQSGNYSNNFTIDLMTYKTDSNLSMNSVDDCFDSPGNPNLVYNLYCLYDVYFLNNFIKINMNSIFLEMY